MFPEIPRQDTDDDAARRVKPRVPDGVKEEAEDRLPGERNLSPNGARRRAFNSPPYPLFLSFFGGASYCLVTFGLEILSNSLIISSLG